jgi:hypothetical protein
MPQELAKRPTPRRRARFGQLFALLGLTGFAISQPLLSTTGENPTLFVFTDVEGLGLVAYALAVALVPPLVLWLVVVLLGLVDRRAGDVVFLALAVVLAGCTVAQLLWSLDVSAELVVALVSLAAAAGFGVLLVRYDNVRRWLRYTAILPVLAVVAFLMMSPTSALLRGRDKPTPAAGSGLPPVVFLMLDELPTQTLLDADREIDRTRFPNLAALADTSTWYRDYSVMATWTDVSVPAILSGQTPKTGQALWTSYPDTIFSLLAPTHQVTAIESFTDLCGYDGCSGSGRASASGDARVGELTSRIAETWWSRLTGTASGGDVGDFAEAIVDQPDDKDNQDETLRAWMQSLGNRPQSADRFLQQLQRTDPPGFYYLHLLFPHQPWVHFPSGEPYRPPDQDSPFAQVEATPWGRAVEEQRHLWQVRYTDAVVGEVMDRLRAQGLYDDALIVVTSDHGVHLEGTNDEGRLAAEETLAEVAFAPLFIKQPGQTAGVVDDSNLMSIDLLPTIAAALGVEIPWSHPGLPAGSPEIAARGDAKEIYDFGDDPRPRFREVIHFDGSVRPDNGHRAIKAPLPADAQPLTLLASTVGLDDVLQSSVTDFAGAPLLGEVTINELDLLRKPLRGPQVAFVSGRVRSPAPNEGVVLLALNGEVVTVAPVAPDGRFATLLPPGVQRREGNEVTVLQLVDGVPTELAVS